MGGQGEKQFIVENMRCIITLNYYSLQILMKAYYMLLMKQTRIALVNHGTYKGSIWP